MKSLIIKQWQEKLSEVLLNIVQSDLYIKPNNLIRELRNTGDFNIKIQHNDVKSIWISPECCIVVVELYPEKKIFQYYRNVLKTQKTEFINMEKVLGSLMLYQLEHCIHIYYSIIHYVYINVLWLPIMRGHGVIVFIYANKFSF